LVVVQPAEYASYFSTKVLRCFALCATGFIMTKIETITRTAKLLSDEQLDGVLAYVRALTGDPVYFTAPADVRASIDRGLVERDAGLGSPARDAFDRLQAKIDAARS
jgi:hypothetical protein